MIVPYPTGLEPKNTPFSRGGRTEIKTRAFRMAAIRLAIDLMICALFMILARQGGDWQFYQLSFFLLILIACDASGALLIRRGRVELGSKLVIGALLVFSPIAVLLTQGLGIVIAISTILVTFTSASETLPPASARKAGALGVVSGISAVLLDSYLPVNNRVSLPPALETTLLVMAGTLIVIYASLVALQIPRYSTQTKLFISFFLISFIPLGVFAYFNNRVTQSALTDAANQSLLAAASETAENLDNFLGQNLLEIDVEADFPLFLNYLLIPPEDRAASGLADEVDALLDVFTQKDPLNDTHLLSYALLDKEGRVVAETSDISAKPGDIPANTPSGGVGEIAHYLVNDRVLTDNFLIVLLTGLTHASPVKFAPGSAEGTIYFMARVADSDGEPAGALVANYSAEVLQEIVALNNNLAGVDSFGVLLDERLTYLAHGTDPDTFARSVAPLSSAEYEGLMMQHRLPDLPAASLSTNLPDLAEKLKSAGENPFFVAEGAAAGDRLNQVAVAELNNEYWKASVAFFQPRDVFLGPINRQNRVVLLITILSGGLVALASIPASQLVSSPITRLTQIVKRIAGGELTARAPVETNDEIGELATSFNRMTDQLNTTLNDLESTVAIRTSDLNRRAIQLQTASLIGREAASIRDIDELFNEATRLIAEQFGYYHCGLFRLDERGEFAVLQAASSEGGKRMLEKGHKLRVGQLGIVGYVASSGLPRLAHDVGDDAVYFDNPDLPRTRSELAVPLKIQTKVVGVLDVQSQDASAFKEDDAEILQVVADQIALALENARLLETSRQYIQELENLYRQQVHEAWNDHLAHKPKIYRYDRVRIQELDAPPSLYTNGSSNGSGHAEDGARTAIARLVIRGQDLGKIVLKRETNQPSWTPEERDLIDTIGVQMSLALENIRLQEETRRRADREHMINEVSARIRRSLDFETVLRTTVREMQAALNLELVEVTLNSDSGVNPAEGVAE
ncbi:MAG TPA: GAF domain-containing protein [Anaerolineales bacterium]|nr:GAF domain-containing protein [Anaerolineales bacterium]